ncbi:MAG: acetyl-CoA carboxylase biotin carboxyl carrier protein [Mariniblastus sp.]|nr:acetyl-CoA carboxylase biotin carboxyl carrier protein [Mariniblastus sp.]
MSKDKSEQQVFDVERIRDLIELMKEHELSEVDLRQDMQRIRLKRGADGPVMVPAAMPAAAAPAAVAATDAPAAAEAEDDNAIYITSPTVGTFYSKPKPDAANFVKVGDMVDADTIVCLVEAMKMFNEIPAGVSGKVVACLVENEDAVEVNKPLFKVVPA